MKSTKKAKTRTQPSQKYASWIQRMQIVNSREQHSWPRSAFCPLHNNGFDWELRMRIVKPLKNPPHTLSYKISPTYFRSSFQRTNNARAKSCLQSGRILASVERKRWLHMWRGTELPPVTGAPLLCCFSDKCPGIVYTRMPHWLTLNTHEKREKNVKAVDIVRS